MPIPAQSSPTQRSQPIPNASPDLSTVRAKFKQIWGYDDFRSPQGEIVQTLLSGQDALILMPTGGGKSICFQLPALLQTGLTLVISPLVALMENQVQELRQKQLPAALLHSQLGPEERRKVLWLLEQQRLRLLYLSPETLLSASVWERLCQPGLVINGLVLDEAHCLAQWGETFRPAYYRLGAVRSALLQHKPAGTRMAIAAFTATADPTVQQTIQRVLQLDNPRLFRLNPYRDNLQLAVQWVFTPRGRRQQLVKFIRSHPQQAGLVYVRTRHDSEELSAWLSQQHYQTAAYHAGLSASQRRQIEQAWLTDQLQFVVCTNAFGMGINKPNVRWVAHYHAPFMLSEYVQEIGRAGRDGQPARALTLVSEPTGWLDPGDKQRWQFFDTQLRSLHTTAQKLAQKLPAQGSVAAVSQQFPSGAIALSLLHGMGQLTWMDPFHYTIASTRQAAPPTLNSTQQMSAYLNTRHCRWQTLLQAFGFAAEAEHLRCGHCDRCQPGTAPSRGQKSK
jgi:ATP-dependent DNA helicase RecQ